MALAIDASSPATAVQTSSSTATVTTASFTPPSNSLLLVLWGANTTGGVNPSSPSITDSLGSPLTYNLLDWQSRANSPTVDGQAASWWAKVGSSAAMTITVTNGVSANNREAVLRVYVITGQDPTTPIGAHGKSGSASAASIAQSYTATATGGWGFIDVLDWAAVGTETAGTGCTLTDSGTVNTNQISYGFVRRTTADDSSGSSNTLNVTLPATSTALSWVYVEVVPPTVAGSASQPLVVSPAWTPARTTPILSSSFPLGNPAQPTPQPLVVVTQWAPRVPGPQLIAAPVQPGAPGPLVVGPPFVWTYIPPVSLTASQPLGNPAVGTPGPLVVTSPWTSRVPGALIVASPIPPPVVTGPTPGPLLVSPPFAWVLVPPNTISASPPSAPAPSPLVSAPPFAWTYIPPSSITASQPLGNPAVPTPGPTLVSPPFLWTPVPISRLFAGFTPPVVVVQVPIEFLIEPPQRLWQIGFMVPSQEIVVEPPQRLWQIGFMVPSQEIVIEPPRHLWEIGMDAERISSLSLERIRFPVFADTAGTVYNPTSDAVSMAFLPTSADPQPTDFHAGTWDTTLIGTYVAQILVGPSGSVTLAKGTYYAWVKIVDAGGETIIRMAGQLIVD